jgi:hypothetical protein
MFMGKLSDKDLCTVFRCVECLAWNLPVDGLEGLCIPAVSNLHSVSEIWATGCLPGSFRESSSDSFAVNVDASLGWWNEWNDLGWI